MLYGTHYREFDFTKNVNFFIRVAKNQLIEKVFIGKFAGSGKGELPIEKSAFVFVINGTFEVQNRLLETRTGFYFGI